ncbi:hypothetical protein FE782_27935 [Paenibacillus antri]|uniref:Uncharacterized protein n=1 Tax=Paenibacillus antri TaxID=2582848 RepID=A0A5R9FY50_9BACL|nr:CBO0543 family protein [Paenibacillus antri]TLS48972.1 hypothetical protein FE782_27935 [Paenibacillus antri]
MEKERTIDLIDRNTAAIEALIRVKIDIWQERVLFTDLWWLGVGLSVVPWIVWYLVRKKSSTDRLFYAALFVAVVSLTLDVLGDQFGIWHYRFNVIPVLPTYLPWDLTLMPVTVLLLLQAKPSANPYAKAIFFALLASFVGEPLFDWLDIYHPKNWRYVYSVPIQFLIYLGAHAASRRSAFEPLA